MNICYGTTGWAVFFTVCELVMIIGIGFLFTKNVFEIYREGEFHHIEFLDWMLITLSIIQIYLMFFSFVFGFYFGFSVLLEVLKFSQNSLIGGILLYQILIWNKFVVTYDLVKYFIVTLLLIDFSAFLISLMFEYPFTELNYCKSNILVGLIMIAFFFNILIILFAVYKNLEDQNDNKYLNILVEDQHNLNDLIQKFATNIKKMKKYYLIIVITLTLSFFTDIYFKLFMTSSIPVNTNNNASTLGDFFTNNTLLNISESSGINSTNYKQSTCSYYGDLKDDFNFKEYFICLISFFFRDISPHIYIYLALFIYKPNINSRSSSFIELI